MEQLSLMSLFKVIGDFGLVGLILFLWWYDNRRIWKVLDQYKSDMMEQREMYKNNASLTKRVADIAEDLRDIVTLNIQKMTELDTAINQNQFCPMVRLDERKVMNIAHFTKDNP